MKHCVYMEDWSKRKYFDFGENRSTDVVRVASEVFTLIDFNSK